MKYIKKGLVLLSVLVLLFWSAAAPKKQAEATELGMTLGAYLAGGSIAAGPVLVGLAGALAIGATIKNWDTVSAYGQRVWDDLTDKGVDPNTLVDTTTNSVTVTDDLINTAAQASTDFMGTAIIDKPATTITINKNLEINDSVVKNIDLSEYAATGLSYTLTVTGAIVSLNTATTGQIVSTLKMGASTLSMSSEKYPVGAFNIYFTGNISPSRIQSYGTTLSVTNLFGGAYGVANIKTIQFDIVGDTQTIDYGSTFESAPDSAYEQRLYANSMLTDNQVMTFSAAQDLTNATLEDVLDTNTAQLDEAATQTGILSKIWQSITSLPATITNGALAAAAAINDFASGLWEDAGAIWSGMSDKLTDIKTNMVSGINTLVDGMANGFDAVQSKLQEWQETWRAGIDNLLNNLLAGIGAFWTDAGIVWDGMLSSLDNLWTGIQDLTGTLVGGLSTTWDRITSMSDAITGSITGALDTVRGWFIPPNWDFVETNMSSLQLVWADKLGGLDDLAAAFKNLFAGANSIYDISVTFKERNYKIVPRFLEPVISGAKPFFTGAVNLFIVTRLYRRARGNEVVR